MCAIFLMSACHDTETYADQKDRERAAINKFITDQGIKVISESDFKIDTITDVSKKEFVSLRSPIPWALSRLRSSAVPSCLLIPPLPFPQDGSSHCRILMWEG